jgi:hypothetical protein
VIVNALVQFKASSTQIVDMVGVFDIIANLVVKHSSRVDNSDRTGLRRRKEYIRIIVTYRTGERWMGSPII